MKHSETDLQGIACPPVLAFFLMLLFSVTPVAAIIKRKLAPLPALGALTALSIYLFLHLLTVIYHVQ